MSVLDFIINILKIFKLKRNVLKIILCKTLGDLVKKHFLFFLGWETFLETLRHGQFQIKKIPMQLFQFTLNTFRFTTTQNLYS